jgi:hypothetical protein
MFAKKFYKNPENRKEFQEEAPKAIGTTKRRAEADTSPGTVWLL